MMLSKRREESHIEKDLSPLEQEKAREFLKRIRPYLATNECIFQPSAKNHDFDNRYSMTHNAKVSVIKNLQAEDCIKIELNNNSRYPIAEVYIFIKSVTITVFGEEEQLKLYIKMYFLEEGNRSPIIVISFHTEGMYNEI